MIEEIRSKFSQHRFEFSQHALDMSILRHISVSEIREAISSGRVIEDYPEDKYGLSCLIFGTTQKSLPVHVHCTYPSRDPIKVITVYEPDPELWINFTTRRES